jgi:hypothetical protein
MRPAPSPRARQRRAPTPRARDGRGVLRRLLRGAPFAAIAVLALPDDVDAWGAKGHRLAATAAVGALPEAMPSFFRRAAAQLAYLNPEPDRWRGRPERDLDPALDGAFGSDHFLDTELAPPEVFARAMAAPHRYAYADTLRAAGIEAAQMGFAPFAILELTQRLRQQFRMWRSAPDSATRGWIEARILDDAGILGHYVTDVANPAHTTIHFNGWTGPNPNGYATDRAFHGRFETAYVQAHLELPDVLPRVAPQPRVLSALRAEILAYLARSHAEVEPLYRLDREDPWGIDTKSPGHRVFAAERLAAGATMLRDLWWTAWVTSGGGAER